MAQKLKTLFFFFVFLFCLFVGISIGKMMDGIDVNEEPKEISGVVERTFTPPTQPAGQNNILVAGVDDLSGPTARLEGAWLIIFETGSLEINLLPLYPVASVQFLQTYQVPHEPIFVSTIDLDALRTVEVLKNQKVFWTDVIMIDEQSIDLVLNVAANYQVESLIQDSNIASTLPKGWDNPESALQKHINIVKFLCDHTEAFSNYEKVKLIIESIYSSVPENELWHLWQIWANQNSEIRCEFFGGDVQK